MLRLAALIWVMVGAVIAGSLVVVVLSMPSLAADAGRMIMLAGIAGYAIAIPIALVIARRVQAATRA